MFATSRKTSTACSVTSGPTPSPGRTTIFSFISVECRDLSQLSIINQDQGRTSPPAKQRRGKAVTIHRTPKSSRHGLRPLLTFHGRWRFRSQSGIGHHQGYQILIVNSLLAIGQVRKATIGCVQLARIKREAKLLVTQRQRVPARMFAQPEFVSWHTYRLRRHDLVTQRVADHAVLVYPGFVRE